MDDYQSIMREKLSNINRMQALVGMGYQKKPTGRKAKKCIDKCPSKNGTKRNKCVRSCKTYDNPWIEHLRNLKKEGKKRGVKYTLKEARASYQKIGEKKQSSRKKPVKELPTKKSLEKLGNDLQSNYNKFIRTHDPYEKDYLKKRLENQFREIDALDKKFNIKVAAKREADAEKEFEDLINDYDSKKKIDIQNNIDFLIDLASKNQPHQNVGQVLDDANRLAMEIEFEDELDDIDLDDEEETMEDIALRSYRDYYEDDDNLSAMDTITKFSPHSPSIESVKSAMLEKVAIIAPDLTSIFLELFDHPETMREFQDTFDDNTSSINEKVYHIMHTLIEIVTRDLNRCKKVYRKSRGDTKQCNANYDELKTNYDELKTKYDNLESYLEDKEVFVKMDTIKRRAKPRSDRIKGRRSDRIKGRRTVVDILNDQKNK